MLTYGLGLIILVIGGFFYGLIVDKVFHTDAKRITPAYYKRDGIDYVPMPEWRNSLIQLLNIAGTGPILGPIQGILFGPIAFITIPIGCVLGGFVHDFLIAMISLRNGGNQLTQLIKKFLGKICNWISLAFICLLLILVGAVFIYTPANLIVTNVVHQTNTPSNWIVWIIFIAILIYYFIATLFPIDKIVGKVYPIFGAVLIVACLCIFVFIFVKDYPMNEIWNDPHPIAGYAGHNFIPIFFVTVACGIVSGFHGTQSTLITKTIKNEKQGRFTFGYMMIVEGAIAMIWAAAAMGIYNAGLATADTNPTTVVGIIATDYLGKYGGYIAIFAVVILAITSGDTALRSLRLTIGEAFGIDNRKVKNRLLICLVIFVVVIGLLLFEEMNNKGFDYLWRYFAWANQTVAVFSFSVATIYMIRKKMLFFIPLIPGTFYFYIVVSFILNAQIGLNIPWLYAYIVAGVLSVSYVIGIIFYGYKSQRLQKTLVEEKAIYKFKSLKN